MSDSDTTSPAPARTGADAARRVDEEIPLGGLGLPLAEEARHGIPDPLFVDALSRVTVPPLVDLGLTFPVPADGGHPRHLGGLFDSLLGDNLPGIPSLDHPALVGLRDMMQIVPLLPIIDLPATGDFWVFEEHLVMLLQHIAQGGANAADLAPLDRWPHPSREPLPFVVPAASGPVLPEHITRFFAGFPALGAALTTRLVRTGAKRNAPVPAALANSVAQAMLGIRVDLRIGSLVSPDEVQNAAGWAGGNVEYRRGGCAYGRFLDFIDVLVPRVDRRGAVFGATGAAWSCAVDATLSSPLAWKCGEDDQFLDASEIPELTDLPRGGLTLK